MFWCCPAKEGVCELFLPFVPILYDAAVQLQQCATARRSLPSQETPYAPHLERKGSECGRLDAGPALSANHLHEPLQRKEGAVRVSLLASAISSPVVGVAAAAAVAVAVVITVCTTAAAAAATAAAAPDIPIV